MILSCLVCKAEFKDKYELDAHKDYHLLRSVEEVEHLTYQLERAKEGSMFCSCGCHSPGAEKHLQELENKIETMCKTIADFIRFAGLHRYDDREPGENLTLFDIDVECETINKLIEFSFKKEDDNG